MAPISAPKMTRASTISADTMPVPTVCATCGAEKQKGDEIEEGRPGDRVARPQNARRHDGGDGICRIVQAVEEIERERDDDRER